MAGFCTGAVTVAVVVAVYCCFAVVVAGVAPFRAVQVFAKRTRLTSVRNILVAVPSLPSAGSPIPYH